MPTLVDVPPSIPNLFKDPDTVGVTLTTLLARIQALEAWTQYDTTAKPNGLGEKYDLVSDSKSEPTEDPIPTKTPPTEDTSPITQNAENSEAVGVLIQEETEEKDDLKLIKLANDILDIVGSYGIREKEYAEQPYEAKKLFLPMVLECLQKGVAVKLVLPAFPFKSPNRQDKVLGSLPDLGEEMALANLQSLCNSIREVYEHGADCYITSDGLVYNDLLGVEDTDVWTYGEALRQIALERKFPNIRFLRLSDLLEIAHHRSGGTGLHSPELPTAEEKRIHHLTHAPCIRRELIARYQPPGFDADKAIKEDTDTRLTYQGYLRFLKKDLEHQERLKWGPDGQPLSGNKAQKVIADIAKRMLARGAAFAAAIRDTYGDSVRLSIHPTVAVTKFPVNLIPQPSGKFGPTPWHSSLALNLDGSLTTGHSEDFTNTHDLVYRHGRPYYYREKSDLWDWGDLEVDFEPIYPCGVIVRPVSGSPSGRLIPMEKVKQLSINLSPIVLRGFSETTDEALFVQKGHEAGKILPWTFGIVQKVKDAKDHTKMGNNVTSNEAMPMHFDGMFKFEERKDPETGEIKQVQIPPGFQFFTTPAVAPEGTGYTLFASSQLFWRYLRLPYSMERLEKILWNMDNDGFWDAKMKNLPLVVRHPATNLPCLRWHEQWDETKTKFSTCRVTISNDDNEIVEAVTKLLYDYRVCLRFTWHVGDWVVNDNISMLHTRTAYTADCDRELWRIHFD